MWTAAGRIHRLGQTKEVLIKRFCYRNTIDAAVQALHAKIKTGEIQLDGDLRKMPPSALALFVEHGVARPHTLAAGQKTVTESYKWNSHLQWSWLNQAGYSRQDLFDFGKSVQMSTCSCCGREAEVSGTSIWWGRGGLSWLNHHTDDVPIITLRNQGGPQGGSASDSNGA